jgi:predicted CoA-binding protein
MTRRATVDAFANRCRLALVGASRSGRKFGNSVLRELTAKGYEVHPVHPEADAIDGVPCVPSLAALPEAVEGIVVVVPPKDALEVVRQAADAGIPRVWLQQGAGSPEVVRIARERGLDVVDGECILMFAEPVRSFHRFHRFVWKVLGKLPA